MGKKVTVEQVKKALQCKQYNASEQFTMDVTGLSHTSLGRIFMLKKADEQAGIDGIYRTGSAAEGLRDVVAEALGYTAADREKAKNRDAADDDSSAEPEQLTLDDSAPAPAHDNAAQGTERVLSELKLANTTLFAINQKLGFICRRLYEIADEKGRDE